MKNKNYHWILHIRISPGYKFKPQQTIPIFETNFPKKDTSGQKQIKQTSPLSSAYLN